MIARHPPSAEPGDSLSRAIDRVAAARAIPGNHVALLTDGPAAFRAMLELIDGARHTLQFENYIIRDDHIGARFADALAAAARRGVAVRVLYDRLGSRRTSHHFWGRLRAAGADVRGFGSLNPLRPVRMLRRDHRKYMGIDGTDAVVGGICIGDEWAGDSARQREPWRDTAVRITGPAAPALDLTFFALWRLTGGMAEPVPELGRSSSSGDATVRVIAGEPGRLRLYRAVELLAAAAAERLWITDAYLVVATPLFANLRSAARDGVDVRILVPGHTDVPALRALTRVGYRELLDSGARIWEWHGPMLHAKTILTDARWYKVGSSNLNPSSYLSNYELDVLIDDESLAADAGRAYRRDVGDSVEVVLRPRRVPVSWSDRLPQAVARADQVPVRGGRTLARGERARRTVVALRTVAGGARRSLVGALSFAAVGTGALFLAIPDVMGYVVAAGCFGLAGLAVGRLIEVRRRRDD